jgi:hypothetical protein
MWSVRHKNWTGNMNFSNRAEWFKIPLNNSGPGQADNSFGSNRKDITAESYLESVDIGKWILLRSEHEDSLRG